ncbi:hypothetical protein BD310DRAFT_434625 [Dichomitus squalens]|uniref:Uncharacterized protein n=1 Tax=Dichomitus squalens TaxID=114155 RepID=A0A4Q9PX89_9APHY|nr:hypothetical protein BD310DRAFT_434625 [Dichomitus squalens]
MSETSLRFQCTHITHRRSRIFESHQVLSATSCAQSSSVRCMAGVPRLPDASTRSAHMAHALLVDAAPSAARSGLPSTAPPNTHRARPDRPASTLSHFRRGNRALCIMRITGRGRWRSSSIDVNDRLKCSSMR